jgi:hypothetical protein
MNVLITVADELQVFRAVNEVVKRILDAPELRAS